MTESREQIERRLADIGHNAIVLGASPAQLEWLIATIESLLPALDVAVAAVARDSASDALNNALDARDPGAADFANHAMCATICAYDAALAAFAASQKQVNP